MRCSALQRSIDLSPIRGRLPNVGAQPNGIGWGPGIAYSPDGKQLAEGSQDGTLLLLDAHTLGVERRVRVGSFAPQLAYNPTGSLLAVGTNHGVMLLDPTTGASRGTIKHTTNAGFLQFSPDGSMLAVNELDPSTYVSHLEVWNVRTHRLPVVSVGPTLGRFGLSSVGFSPRRSPTAGREFQRRWCVRHTRLASPRHGSQQPTGAASGVQSRRLADCCRGGSAQHRARPAPRPSNCSTRTRSSPARRSSAPPAPKCGRRGERIPMTTGSRSTPAIHSASTASRHAGLVFQSGLGVGLYEIAFSPDGRQLAVTSSDGNGAVYRASGTERAEIDPGGINPNGGVRVAVNRTQVVAAFWPTSRPNFGRLIVQEWSWSGRPNSRPLILAQNARPDVWDRPKGRVGIRRPIRLQPGRTRYAHPRSDLGSQPATSDENTDGDRRI